LFEANPAKRFHLGRQWAPEHRELTMFRKLALSAVAAISLGAAALAPTPAAAWGWHGGFYGYHHAWGPRFYFGVPVSYGYGSCYVQRLVPTPWGPRWRLVNSCY